jgi:hypothetical protein
MTAKIEFEIAGLRSLAKRTLKILHDSPRFDIRVALQCAGQNWTGVEVSTNDAYRDLYLGKYFDCEAHLMHFVGVRDE